MRTLLRSTFQSLRVRNFRLFTIGQLVKLIGVWAQFTAQDWLVLQITHDSATALATVTALQFVPVLLLTLAGGGLADRYDKHRLLIVVNVAFAVITLGMAVLVASGLIALWQVYVFAAVMGTINAVETPARQAFVTELVGGRLLPNALGLSAATFNTAKILGPAAAGAAIAVAGIGPVFVADAVLCCAPVFCLTRMNLAELYRGQRPAGRGGEPVRVLDGLRYVWRRQDVLVPVIMVFVIGMLGFNFQITLALMAKTVFHTSASSFGLLSATLAVGSLAGALASSSRRSRPSLRVVVVAAALFGALETIVGMAPTLTTAALALLPTGFCMIYFAQAANQRVQLGVEPEYRGRVMAVYVLVFLGTTPIGASVVGWAATNFGPRSGIWLGGVASLVMAIGTALLASPGAAADPGVPVQAGAAADPGVLAQAAAAADPGVPAQAVAAAVVRKSGPARTAALAPAGS